MISFADVTVYENDYEDPCQNDALVGWNWTNGAMTSHTVVFADYSGNTVVEHTGVVDNSLGSSASNVRFGSKWDIVVSGNTSADANDYIIEFDIQNFQAGEDWWDPMPLEFFVLTGGGNGIGRGSGVSNYYIDDGWVHVEKSLAELTVGWWNGTAWDLTSTTPWSIEVGGPGWPGTSVPAGTDAWSQIWLMDNLEITMIPEPATIALLGLGGLALLRRKRA